MVKKYLKELQRRLQVISDNTKKAKKPRRTGYATSSMAST